ncbi:MAG: CBS domain-containing protein [PVC group bacterium]|nr:CBS domain-containing protein [PVC group bacterium]
MIAENIMTSQVSSVFPTLEIRELAIFLVEKNISGAPVVDDQGDFLGIVTEEDLIFQDKKVHLPTFLNLFSVIIPLGVEQTEEELIKIAGQQVKDIMQKEPRTISKNTTIEDIATLMSEDKHYYLPVLEDSKVVGIVTKRDLIKAVAKGKIW